MYCFFFSKSQLNNCFAEFSGGGCVVLYVIGLRFESDEQNL